MTARATFGRRLSTRRASGVVVGAAVACGAFVVGPTVTARAATTTTSTSATTTTQPPGGVGPGGVIGGFSTTTTAGSTSTSSTTSTTQSTTTTSQPTTSTTDPGSIGPVGTILPPVFPTSTIVSVPALPPPNPSTTRPTTTTTQQTTTTTRPNSTTSSTTATDPPTPSTGAAPTSSSPGQPAVSLPVAPGTGFGGAPGVATQPWFLALPPVGNGTATPAQAVGTDAPWAAPIATVVRDPADGAAPAATLRGGYQAEVVDARSKGDVVALSAIPRPRPSTGGSLLISIDLPGEATELGLELRPSRIAAAWLVWLAVTFAVLAFWLPGSARRLRRDGSSKPSR